MFEKKLQLPSDAEALPGRAEKMPVAKTHFVNGNPMTAPFPTGLAQAMFGMGCFWGAERRFWEQKGVFVTAVGYASGITPNPTYEEVCTGLTGHNEVVWLVFDPNVITYEKLLQQFWESHNPTQGMRQGNDIGTQYRSGIYTYSNAQYDSAKTTLNRYQQALNCAGTDRIITTEILPAPTFYYAEDYHQQYLAKNPRGYCGLGGIGVKLEG